VVIPAAFNPALGSAFFGFAAVFFIGGFGGFYPT
jgi:hypothetical protein